MIDKKLFIYTVLLITIGIFFTYSLSTYVILLFGYDDYHFLLRQSIFALISIFTMWALAQLNPDIWLKRIGMSLFLGGILLMIAMPFMPASLVSEVGGAKRWIRLFGFSLAPVEFFKIGFIYFLAWSFSRKLGHHRNMGIKNEFIRFSPYAMVMLIVMFLIAFMQKDLGQVVVLSVTLLFLLMFAGSSFKFFFSLIVASISFGVIAIIAEPHRIKRIESWWASAQDFILSIFPESIAQHLRVTNFEEPYQIGHSLNAINNGGFFGAGIGNGTFKLGFLSEVHTDFILAGIAEEIGFVGVLLVTVLFIMLLQRIFKVANRTKNEVVHLFSVGVGLLIASAFFLNAYGISGMTPIKGISVPFLSYGGSSMLASSIGIGMVLMASKKIDLEEKI
jgi:cell division protein FtsW